MADDSSIVTGRLNQVLSETSFLYGANGAFVEDLYAKWAADQSSVEPSWRAFFGSLHEQADTVRKAATPPPWTPKALPITRPDWLSALDGMWPAVEAKVAAKIVEREPAASPEAVRAATLDSLRAIMMIRAYRMRGHLAANLDPLGLSEKADASELDPANYGFAESDFDRPIFLDFVLGLETSTIREITAILRRTYCGNVGVQYMHISSPDEKAWLQQRIEGRDKEIVFTPEGKIAILKKLIESEAFERFLHKRFPGTKRFGLDGAEATVPALEQIIKRGGALGVEDIVIGMPHRGRLNVLAAVMGKPYQVIFHEFQGGSSLPSDIEGSGDVKYHLGASSDREFDGNKVHLSLTANPSHLEIVNPVVTGSVHARQTRRRDTMHTQSLAVLIHGDAALAGQGVNMELFNMSQARGFTIGGSMHIVINNQVGFTTSNPQDARSTMYCTDLAKMVNAPVLHVNGDDPEAVIAVTRLAYDFRKQFRRDVVIDLVCYRRHGHNEADEPAATQPVMYQVIRKLPTTRDLYQQKLVKEGVLAEGDAQKQFEAYRDRLEAGAPMTELDTSPTRDGHVDWARFIGGKLSTPTDTTVSKAKLQELSSKILTLPADITLQARVAKIYDDRRKMASGEQPADWGFAENLAYATLIDAGSDMRLVGQDSGRGTFFHRHAVLHDQKDGHTYMPLATLRDGADVEVIDSLLSEEAVMAFEYGHSTTDPDTLNIWEAQFGDFANGAQVVIDQFISSGEAKWNRLSGLVLLLPHGYEGQGPEHSSARLERFLQMCAMENMQVCVPTTPAQDFHMIRRQMLRPVRKPLIVMTPKSLLRHKLAVSSLDELANGSFQLVIGEHRELPAKKVKRVVLCSGKVYYDLLEESEKRGITDVAIVRVEQLYPFPRAEVSAELNKYPAAKEVIWCQEEPMNQGAWFQIRHHLQACIGSKQSLSYAGRARSPAPAAGHLNTHVAEQAALVEQALVAAVGTDHSAE